MMVIVLYRVVGEGGAVVQAGVVVEQLDVAGLQHGGERQFRRARERVEERHGLVVRGRQAGDLWEALRCVVVIVTVVDAQVALCAHQRGHVSDDASFGKCQTATGVSLF